jgi:hypothetical protein
MAKAISMIRLSIGPDLAARSTSSKGSMGLDEADA